MVSRAEGGGVSMAFKTSKCGLRNFKRVGVGWRLKHIGCQNNFHFQNN